MHQVVVIGAGPHGVAAAGALTEVFGPGEVVVVDPEEVPLAAWSRRAEAIGMDCMRSPWVHHVSRHPHALLNFQLPDSRTGLDHTPSVALFEAHAHDCFARAAPSRAGGTVVDLVRAGGTDVSGARSTWSVHLAGEAEPLRAGRVVVATGLGPHRRPGLGGVPLPEATVRPHRRRVAVIGGGHTGATAARKILAGGGRVDLFAPAGLRVMKTDVDPGWFGPRYLTAYERATPETRLARLREARRGSTPPGLAAWLRARIPPGLLRVLRRRALGVSYTRAGASVVVAGGPAHGPYEEVYEAVGYHVDVGNVPWLARHVGAVHGGWPVLDRYLQAAPGLHVLGALAELELGPAGRNLWGAQRAAERLLDSCGLR